MSLDPISLLSIAIGIIAIIIGIYVMITVRKFIKQFETDESHNEKPITSQQIVEQQLIAESIKKKPFVSIKLKKEEEPVKQIEEELKI